MWFLKRLARRAMSGIVNRMRKLVALAGLLALCAGCSDGCTNNVASRVPSPDGRHDAVLFGRDCGATAGFSTQVSVLGPGEQPRDAGNALRADDDHGAARKGAWGGPWVELLWLGPDRLLVRYAARARLFEQEETVSGVRIVHEVADGT